MNFGETLAYWYLRLNGFIPLANFVLHRPEPPETHNADADLLAVRFPHVFEEVGGKQDDWDDGRMREWGLPYTERPVCLICEVKSGKYDQNDLARPFGRARIIYALHRLAALAPDDIHGVGERLEQSAVLEHGGVTFGKLLIATRVRPLPQQGQPWLGMTLNDCVEFIEARMRKFREQKHAARMFFPDDLVQFFAWRAGVGNGNLPNGPEDGQL
jgi:hypothetical protein